MFFFFDGVGDHLDLHLLTTSLPTRPYSDLRFATWLFSLTTLGTPPLLIGTVLVVVVDAVVVVLDAVVVEPPPPPDPPGTVVDVVSGGIGSSGSGSIWPCSTF